MGMFSECTRCVETGKMRFATPICEHCGKIVCGYVGSNGGDGLYGYCMSEVARQEEESRQWAEKERQRKQRYAREDFVFNVWATAIMALIAVTFVGYHYLF